MIKTNAFIIYCFHSNIQCYDINPNESRAGNSHGTARSYTFPSLKYTAQERTDIACGKTESLTGLMKVQKQREKDDECSRKLTASIPISPAAILNQTNFAL